MMLASRRAVIGAALFALACGGATHPGGPPGSAAARSQVQRISAAYTGCAPSEHEITDYADDDWVWSWRARCGASAFRCYRALAGDAHCAAEP